MSDDGQAALTTLDDAKRFANLHHLIDRMRVTERLEGDEYALIPPHERVQARAWGWPETQPPWAALLARADGLDVHSGAWGLLTPCHWHLGRDHFTMLPPDGLDLDEPTSRALFEAIAPLFEDEGWQVHWGAPMRWYVVHDSLRDLPSASLDRVTGRNPDLWMPQHAQSRWLRRLQAEVQMLWYQHPVNDAREAQGQLRVNSFWLSGCGEARPVTLPGPTALDGPRQALLKGDTAAWIAAWDAIERDTLPGLIQALDAGQAPTLTLCGERHAVTLGATPPASWWQRWSRRWTAPKTRPSALLADL